MPRAPKPCAKCTTLVRPPAVYCDTHQPPSTWNAYPSANARTHTRAQRATFRRQVLDREPHCRACGAPATEADHIVPVSQGGNNNPVTNGQGLCSPCHHTKTRAEARDRR